MNVCFFGVCPIFWEGLRTTEDHLEGVLRHKKPSVAHHSPLVSEVGRGPRQVGLQMHAILFCIMGSEVIIMLYFSQNSIQLSYR